MFQTWSDDANLCATCPAPICLSIYGENAADVPTWVHAFQVHNTFYHRKQQNMEVPNLHIINGRALVRDLSQLMLCPSVATCNWMNACLTKMGHSLLCHVSDCQGHCGDAIQISFMQAWCNLECIYIYVYCDAFTVSICWETCNPTLGHTLQICFEGRNPTMCHLFFFHQTIPNAHILNKIGTGVSTEAQDRATERTPPKASTLGAW